jgi:hypothetical protein
VAYRGDDAGQALEAPTAEGVLRATIAPNRIELSVAKRRLVIEDRTVTLVDAKDKRASLRIETKLVVARDVPREDVGVWVELPGPTGAAMRRVFGVEPVSLFAADGLAALKRLDTLAQRLKAALADHAGDIRKAIELGRGLDKVLLADHGDRYVIYARRLFRDRARFALAIYRDGRVVLPDGKELREFRINSKFGITVRGDYVRCADPPGTDLARVAIPWIAAEDRDEIARRIGQLVHATSPSDQV